MIIQDGSVERPGREFSNSWSNYDHTGSSQDGASLYPNVHTWARHLGPAKIPFQIQIS